jgi:hypothetical protein
VSGAATIYGELMTKIAAALASLILLTAMASAQPVSTDPRIQKIEIEEPGRTSIRAVYRVTIIDPLEESDLKEIAETLRSQVRHTDAVGIRFVLSNVQPEERDPEAGRPFYAWRLVITGNKTDIFNITGISKAQVDKQVAAFVPSSGDKVRGIWIDHSNLLGVIALVDRPEGIYFLHLADLDRRFLMKKVTSKRTVTWLEAVYSESGGQRFKADGHGTDRVGVHLAADGTLRVHGGRYQLAAKPWLIATPQKR